jgi:hypothetical protein
VLHVQRKIVEKNKLDPDTALIMFFVMGFSFIFLLLYRKNSGLGWNEG